MLHGHFPRVLRAARKLSVRDDQSAIRFQHVLLGMLARTSCGHLLKPVFFWKPSVFRFPSFWNPATMGDSQLYGNIESSLVSSGLAPRDDFANHHTLSSGDRFSSALIVFTAIIDLFLQGERFCFALPIHAF
jgi:hypothetical protein